MSAPEPRRPLVAIDGPGGAGKSTVAHLLAARLGVARLDTGATYRAVTLRALRGGVDPADEESVAKLAGAITLELGDPERVLADGEDVTAAIRSPEVDAAVSVVAAIPAVRAELVRRQQAWIASHEGAVVEGRDIGAVVAPQADLKVFLTASAAERAERRAAQNGTSTDRGAVGEAMARRDRIDSSREHSPLEVAPGAVVVDSTGRSAEDVVEQLLGLLAGAEPSEQQPVVEHRPAEQAPGASQVVAAEQAPTARGAPEGGLVAGRPIRRSELWFYAACRLVVVGFGRLFFPATVVGAERLPARGAYILAPVHRSNLDWLVVARLTRRRLRYLAKDQVWKVKPAGRLVELLGAFPVHRAAADREALHTALSVLAGGEPLVLFPEGTRRSGPQVSELRDGAAYLACRAGVPIVPVGIAGTEEAMPRGRVLPRPARLAIVVGEAVLPASRTGATSPGTSPRHVPRSAVRATSEALAAALQRCLDEASDLRSPARLPSQPGSGALPGGRAG